MHFSAFRQIRKILPPAGGKAENKQAFKRINKKSFLLFDPAGERAFFTFLLLLSFERLLVYTYYMDIYWHLGRFMEIKNRVIRILLALVKSHL